MKVVAAASTYRVERRRRRTAPCLRDVVRAQYVPSKRLHGRGMVTFSSMAVLAAKPYACMWVWTRSQLRSGYHIPGWGNRAFHADLHVARTHTHTHPAFLAMHCYTMFAKQAKATKDVMYRPCMNNQNVLMYTPRVLV